jgi:hypothetical protein
MRALEHLCSTMTFFNIGSGAVVNLNWNGCLCVARFFKCHADLPCLFAFVEEASKLIFDSTLETLYLIRQPILIAPWPQVK